ncbi:hypothetical protein GCM10022600_15080 [Qipengyuania pelagi]|uniref:Uncharacterized protein n=1 Tax=Qipengyuania pelagi TaxID=994320 RepID=A0A844Y8B6_9SPHN|nr:hypothetical protein [Qipengyuania pelagi]MXO53637.1 hypothetical protein [Qipengyuania pelagi]
MTDLPYLEAALAGNRDAWVCPLRDELNAAIAGMPHPAMSRVLALGAPNRFLGQLVAAGDVAAARVSIHRPRRGPELFEIGGPDARLLIGVREQGVLVDICALATHEANQWALRRGDGWCLGYDAWLACETGAARALRIVATPLAWLRGGGAGVCVLDWDIGVRMLRGLGEGVTLKTDRGAGERLRALLQHGGFARQRGSE